MGHQDVLELRGWVDYFAEEETIEVGDQREASTRSRPKRSSRQLNVSELEEAAIQEALLLASMAPKVEKGTRAPPSSKVLELASTEHIRTRRKRKAVLPA